MVNVAWLVRSVAMHPLIPLQYSNVHLKALQQEFLVVLCCVLFDVSKQSFYK